MSEELLDQIFLFGLGETAAAPTAVVSFFVVPITGSCVDSVGRRC